MSVFSSLTTSDFLKKQQFFLTYSQLPKFPEKARLVNFSKETAVVSSWKATNESWVYEEIHLGTCACTPWNICACKPWNMYMYNFGHVQLYMYTFGHVHVPLDMFKGVRTCTCWVEKKKERTPCCFWRCTHVLGERSDCKTIVFAFV